MVLSLRGDVSPSVSTDCTVCLILITPTAPCPTLDTPTNGTINYDNVTNVATYNCDTGYNSTENGQVTCQSNNTWTANITCTSEFLYNTC